MIVLGLDLETTGLDVEKDEIVEIGAVLWDAQEGKPISLMSSLIAGVECPEDARKVHGISKEVQEKYGTGIFFALQQFWSLAREAEAYVAHNGNLFDRPFLTNVASRAGVTFPRRTWIDTSTDLPIPESITTRKLVHLAAEHGFLNPFAHRAVFDVLTMLKVLSSYPIQQVYALAREPLCILQALVSYDDRDKAKARGYRWGTQKMWLKGVKKPYLDQELREAPFKVRLIEERSGQ